MNLNQINRQAKESLEKYFKNAYELNREQDPRNEMTVEELKARIKEDVIKQKQHTHQLRMMKELLENDAKIRYEKVFGKNETKINKPHHETIKEMQAKLQANAQYQLAYVGGLKQKALSK